MPRVFDVAMLRGDFGKEVDKLRTARTGGVRKELRKALTNATKPTRRKIRDAARERLPQKGGLAKWAGVMPALITDFRTDRQQVIIRDSKRGHDLEAIDRGRLRHPLYGNRNYWYEQQIAPGFFTETVQAETPRIRALVWGGLSAYLETIGEK
ncbi:hypothetical protein ATY41_02720 [Leifsonia xyli subsp. xyli]|uniref:HK97 gp10 family phage protein n=1 Tax=Leifsonia xyli subsp. xyli TaxID=59736 RepID=A0A1E2SJS0_LEIXY|nr:hypothetical protein [Leifsonia xyli]ODA89971.1 hypothetical protein ATY41_02720 [Leifsonia xyli subsp. xyli]